MGNIRIVIADDHPVVRAGLQEMLRSQPDFEIVGEASNGVEAVTLVNQVQPDVVLMDLRMTLLDGAAATEEILAHQAQTTVLVLTSYESNADILRAIEAGAMGYLLKDAKIEELFTAVRTVAQGKAVFAPTIATRLLYQVRNPSREALSARELEVLALVARGASNKDIARTIHLSEATVKSHLLHMFAKLAVSDRTAAVTVALERGLLHLDS